MPHPGKLDGELGVLINLAISIGMVLLTVAGWWLWKTFPGTVKAMLFMPSDDLP